MIFDPMMPKTKFDARHSHERECDEEVREFVSSGDDFSDRPKDVRWEPAAVAAADDATGDLDRTEDRVGAETERLG